MVPPWRALSRVKRLKHQGVLGGRGGEVELVALLCRKAKHFERAYVECELGMDRTAGTLAAIRYQL